MPLRITYFHLKAQRREKRPFPPSFIFPVLTLFSSFFYLWFCSYSPGTVAIIVYFLLFLPVFFICGMDIYSCALGRFAIIGFFLVYLWLFFIYMLDGYILLRTRVGSITVS